MNLPIRLWMLNHLDYVWLGKAQGKRVDVIEIEVAVDAIWDGEFDDDVDVLLLLRI